MLLGPHAKTQMPLSYLSFSDLPMVKKHGPPRSDTRMKNLAVVNRKNSLHSPMNNASSPVNLYIFSL